MKENAYKIGVAFALGYNIAQDGWVTLFNKMGKPYKVLLNGDPDMPEIRKKTSRAESFLNDYINIEKKLGYSGARVEALKTAIKKISGYASIGDINEILSISEKALNDAIRSKENGLSYMLDEHLNPLADKIKKIRAKEMERRVNDPDFVMKKYGFDIREFGSDSDIRNDISPDSAEWGSKAGTYTIFRSGNPVNNEVVFYASDYSGASNYSTYSTKKPDRYNVKGFEVEIKKPFIQKDLISSYNALFGGNMTISDLSPDVWKRMDVTIAKELRRRGYDAWVMTSPDVSGATEMAIVDKGIIEKLKKQKPVFQRVPNQNKNALKEDIKADLF